jgi:myo-inositol 2-dehydrogenase/D-chiro-inositol 1-dehydrogenase
MTKKIAVIGAGGMGQFHAATLAKIPGVELAAVCDVVPETAQAMANLYDTKLALDPAAVATTGYDGVVIASPDNTHAELTLLALGAGSRVLCEKPLSDTVAGAQAVVDAEAKLGERRVQLGFMREYDAAHIGLAIELAKLGPLQYLRCTHRNTNEIARSPEVVLVQSLVHDIHTVHWLAGPVSSVDARVTERPGGLAHVLLVMRIASGATATVEFSDNTYAYEVEVEATTENAMVTTSAPQRPRLRIDGDHRTPIGDDWFGWFADAYRTQDAAWVESLSGPAAVGPSAQDSLTAQKVAEAALESIANGGEVQVL